MCSQGYLLWREMLEMDLCSRNEVKDFEARKMKRFDTLVQVKWRDDLAEVKEFGTWVEATMLFQMTKQNLESLIFEASLSGCE